VITTRQAETFDDWFRKLRDRQAKHRIQVGIDKLELGLGDVQPVGDDVWELRIHYGPGYRLYFVKRGQTVIFLLWGGHKGSQTRDIAKAKKIAEELE
jgi:putative addiction module killer protein